MNRSINNKYLERRKRMEGNNVGLTFNERISRILLVIGMFSLFSIAFDKLNRVLQTFFSAMYINTEIPLGIEHILILTLLADISLIICIGIIYCCLEFFNFSIYKSKVDKSKYESYADSWFKKLLGISIMCLIFTLLSVYVLLMIFTTKMLISLLMTIPIILSFIYLLCYVIKNKNLPNLRFFQTFELSKLTMVFILPFWLLLGIVFMEVGVIDAENTEKSYVHINFQNQNGVVLNIEFKNKEPDNILIQSDKNKTIHINKKDFSEASVTVTNENPGDNMYSETSRFLFIPSYNLYGTKVSLDNLLQNGKNVISITFMLSDTSKNSYTITNEIKCENGKVEIYKNNFNVSLDKNKK